VLIYKLKLVGQTDTQKDLKDNCQKSGKEVITVKKAVKKEGFFQ
jgi:hypothetical protein